MCSWERAERDYVATGMGGNFNWSLQILPRNGGVAAPMSSCAYVVSSDAGSVLKQILSWFSPLFRISHRLIREFTLVLMNNLVLWYIFLHLYFAPSRRGSLGACFVSPTLGVVIHRRSRRRHRCQAIKTCRFVVRFYSHSLAQCSIIISPAMMMILWENIDISCGRWCNFAK